MRHNYASLCGCVSLLRMYISARLWGYEMGGDCVRINRSRRMGVYVVCAPPTFLTPLAVIHLHKTSHIYLTHSHLTGRHNSPHRLGLSACLEWHHAMPLATHIQC